MELPIFSMNKPRTCTVRGFAVQKGISMMGASLVFLRTRMMQE